MKMTLRIIVLGFLFSEVMTFAQINYYRALEWGQLGTGSGGFQRLVGLELGPNNLVAVSDWNDFSVKLFDRQGNFVRLIPHGDRVNKVRFGPDDHLYSCTIGTGSTKGLRVYRINGSLVRQFGASDWYPALAVHTNLNVYAANSDTDMIEVWNPSNAMINSWGASGTGIGQFQNVRGMEFGPDGNLYVLDITTARVQVFTPAGTFVRFFDVLSLSDTLSFNHDGNLLIARGLGFNIYSLDGTLLESLANLTEDGNGLQELAVDERGDIWSTEWTRIIKFEKSFRTIGGARNHVIPVAHIDRVAMRPGSGIMDIDFTILDPDSPLVTVSALAYVDGDRSFPNTLPLATLVEGTESKLNQAIATGVTHRVSWNVAADWNVDFGVLEIGLLANDGRAIIDLHLITIPANNGAPELTISRVPLQSPDLLPAWRWYIANQHPDILLENGAVKSAANTAITFVDTNGVTTGPGAQWLYAELGYRVASANENRRAKEAWEGNAPGAPVVEEEPLVKLQPANIPEKVNAFGFDSIRTGDRLVPLP